MSDIVGNFLTREPIYWLLKGPLNKEEERARRNDLLDIFQTAADMSPDQGAAHGHHEFQRLEDLEKTFHVASDKLKAYEHHCLEDGDTELDGRRVLLVVQPAVIRRLWILQNREDDYQVCTKAEVVIEDPQGQEDAEADSQGEVVVEGSPTQEHDEVDGQAE